MPHPTSALLPGAIVTRNRGALICSTNYFGSAHARAGLFFLSWHAGTARLLIPASRFCALRDMLNATYVAVTRGRYEGVADCLEVMFDDGSATPYAVYLLPHQYDRMIPGDDNGAIDVRLYPRVGEWISRSGFYRVVERLPCLEVAGEGVRSQYV